MSGSNEPQAYRLSVKKPMRKRALPRPVTGKKMRYGILPHGTKGLIDAALKVWELRNGLGTSPSAWQRNPRKV
ncbi:MAG: hypothetical protein DMF06_12200 [Verrucomicrobia bacterium]|nr:MAG: hypothetical protein DMF06_12200 [Verrucomicrobiota bacterium]